ncbi:hypothetical protein SDC9_207548 [bioreactor metagenome]|uniref:Uncharacterized protein n=1 Tax=bioreactor metagenome TaxID=1076179 RepID=A0A645J8S2_9ZZZZ
MGNREVDGFHIWAEASQQGGELAGAFVLTKAVNGKVGTKRFRVLTAHTFTSLEAAQAAPIQRSCKRSHQFPTLLTQSTRLLNMGGVSMPLDLKVESGLR